MTCIILKIRDDEVGDAFIVEDRGCGLDIRLHGTAICDAGSSAVLDLDGDHCESCTESIADRIGLHASEVEKISRWRDRKEHGVSSRELGLILDKIVDKLDLEFEDCDRKPKRIVIEVEDANG